MGRPHLDKNISIKDFNDFYWLKKELTVFCQSIGISTVGGKVAISNRIRHYLSTGEIIKRGPHRNKSKSKFNWKKERLTLDTIITDNYTNGENVRGFFKKEIGSHFSFNVIFMKWMKENVGKTLGDAVIEWNKIKELKKDKKHITPIDPQFEYNRYMSAFLKDRPELSRKEAIKYWKLKSAQRGSNEYDREDLTTLQPI